MELIIVVISVWVEGLVGDGGGIGGVDEVEVCGCPVEK
jgi:hypothetical protein